MSTVEYRQKLERLKGQRDQISMQICDAEDRLKRLQAEQKIIQKAQAIVQQVAQLTQKELEYHISELVSLALDAVFDDPYKLNLDFEVKRGKSEAILSFSKKDDIRIDPISASGGGAVDVASFALRVALWSLKQNKTRNTVILDEPFRFLSRDLQPMASAMLKEISKRLHLQFIIVTHEENLLEEADKRFKVTKDRKGISSIVPD